MGYEEQWSRARSHAVNAVLANEGIMAKVDAVAREAGFKTYARSNVGDMHGFARRVADVFLTSFDVSSAVEEIVAGHDHEDALSMAIEEVRRAGGLEGIVAAISDFIQSRDDFVDQGDATRSARDLARSALAMRMEALDDSHPAELMKGQEVVLCYVPDGHLDAHALKDSVTNHHGVASDATTIAPDANFGRLLRLANITASEYVDLVARERGVDLNVIDPRWSELAVETDHDRGRLVDDEALLDGIDGATYGFNPLIAFTADVSFLITRDWSRPLTVTGGMLGLHNFMNGSGCPLRFEGAISISAEPGDLIVGEGRRYDFSEVYGLDARSFAGTTVDGISIESLSPKA